MYRYLRALPQHTTSLWSLPYKVSLNLGKSSNSYIVTRSQYNVRFHCIFLRIWATGKIINNWKSIRIQIYKNCSPISLLFLYTTFRFNIFHWFLETIYWKHVFEIHTSLPTCNNGIVVIIIPNNTCFYYCSDLKKKKRGWGGEMQKLLACRRDCHAEATLHHVNICEPGSGSYYASHHICRKQNTKII